jgi:phosphoribosyl 1,2-cyclic phosphodiesterase
MELSLSRIRCFHHKLPVYGFRVGDLTYITDTNSIPGEELEKVKGTRILIVNALRKEKHISHFNLGGSAGSDSKNSTRKSISNPFKPHFWQT